MKRISGMVVGMMMVAWMAGLLGLADHCRAQHSVMSTSIFSDSGTFGPELSRQDLDVFKRVLALQPAEFAAMEELHGAYVNTLKTEGYEVRHVVSVVMEEAEAMGDMTLLGPAHQKLAEWTKRSDELKRTFMDDLKALLTRDQEARWPIVERELRRMKLLRGGRVPGEQVDLVELINELPASVKESPEMVDLLERYSQEMDRAIVSRAAFFEKNDEKFKELVTSDPPAAKALFERSTREREAVVSVNDRYLREIANGLTTAEADALRDRYFNACYPLLAKGTRGERYIKAAGKLDTLSTEQRSTLGPVLAEYDRDRRAILARMAELVREDKRTTLPQSLANALNPPSPETVEPPSRTAGFSYASAPSARDLREDKPYAKLRRSRYELDRACRAKVDAILTPDQQAVLPDLALEPVTVYDDSTQGM